MLIILAILRDPQLSKYRTKAHLPHLPNILPYILLQFLNLYLCFSLTTPAFQNPLHSQTAQNSNTFYSSNYTFSSCIFFLSACQSPNDKTSHHIINMISWKGLFCNYFFAFENRLKKFLVVISEIISTVCPRRFAMHSATSETNAGSFVFPL